MHGMADEKQRKFKIRIRPSKRNYIGLFFSLVGFLLILLCLVGSRTVSGKGLHFARLIERPAGPLTIYIGWQGYCTEESTNDVKCYTDDGVMMMPFDVNIAEKFNETYPHLFADPVEQDPDLNPEAQPNPPHNPKIYAGSILCLLSGGAAAVVGIAWWIYYPQFQDKNYSRGFLAWMAAVLSLLLVAQSAIMYQNGIEQLNLVYPHLEAIQGPNLALAGVAFACFIIAGYTYLHGLFKTDDEEAALGDGYNPL
ncbi:hypothetical protein K492DRAFT_144851 [Lichtheimia hyalospora FSU 10163]|nr:hypothetical protein K492DRAFT_144851 [Lichtheimia hyalospora FSU 10163]